MKKCLKGGYKARRCNTTNVEVLVRAAANWQGKGAGAKNVRNDGRRLKCNVLGHKTDHIKYPHF